MRVHFALKRSFGKYAHLFRAVEKCGRRGDKTVDRDQSAIALDALDNAEHPAAKIFDCSDVVRVELWDTKRVQHFPFAHNSTTPAHSQLLFLLDAFARIAAATLTFDGDLRAICKRKSDEIQPYKCGELFRSVVGNYGTDSFSTLVGA